MDVVIYKPMRQVVPPFVSLVILEAFVFHLIILCWVEMCGRFSMHTNLVLNDEVYRKGKDVDCDRNKLLFKMDASIV